MNAERLVDRYLNEIGHYLPRRLRAGVCAELRNLLMEQIADVAAQEGIDPAQAAARVIEGFGSPAEIASRYADNPRAREGGPAVRRLAILLVTLQGLTFGLNALNAHDGGVLAPALPALLGQFIANVLISLGALLVFAHFWSWLGARLSRRRAEWSATDLEPSPFEPPNRLILLLALVLLAAGIALMVVTPNAVAVVVALGGSTPVVGAHLVMDYLPWLIGLMCGWIVVVIGLFLNRGRRNLGLLWLALTLKLATIGLFVYLLATEQATNTSLLNPGLRIALYFGLAAAAAQVAIQSVRLVLVPRRLSMR